MPFIEVKEIFKNYAEQGKIITPGLRGVDLAIEKGDFVSIAGPSGSGKTTLLNLIGALDKPTSGKIIFDGKDITTMPIGRLADFRLREIGFVFQAYNLFNSLTALENVEYVMLLQGIASALRKNRAKDLLQQVGLGDLMHKRPNQLSGGEQQRVAVVRAIAANPRLVLADEPTANLDSVTAVNLIALMRQLNLQLSITFIFSTHDKMVVEKADKAFHLKDGKII